jgi:hypothetical protein
MMIWLSLILHITGINSLVMTAILKEHIVRIMLILGNVQTFYRFAVNAMEVYVVSVKVGII